MLLGFHLPAAPTQLLSQAQRFFLSPFPGKFTYAHCFRCFAQIPNVHPILTLLTTTNQCPWIIPSQCLKDQHN